MTQPGRFVFLLLCGLLALLFVANVAQAHQQSLAHKHSDHHSTPSSFHGDEKFVPHHPTRTSKSAPTQSLECSLCDFILRLVDEEIGENTTEPEIVALLQNICVVFDLTPNLKKSCENIIAKWGETLVFILEEELAEDRVCSNLEFCITNFTQPVHVHLALNGNPDQMTVSWFTYGTTASSTARWALSPNGQVIGSASGTTSSYLQGGGVTHKSVLSGLQPGTTYYYSVGDNTGGWSPQYSFTTAPLKSHNFSIGLYGDMGVHYSENTIPRIKQLVDSGRVEWIYHVGDIGYGDDYPGNVYEYVWNSWFRATESITAKVPYQVCPGNHEYNCQHPTCAYFSGNFAAYNSRFRMPGPESGSNTNMFYSFDYSYVHWISVSTETDYPQAPYPSKFGNQLQWLENDLKKANASRSSERPWIIVIGHRPIYSSQAQIDGKASDYALHIQTAMEDMFHAYGVDIYFTGHVHAYERAYPTYANKKVSSNYINPTAAAHVVAGAAGCIEGLSQWKTSPPDWIANRFNADQGYGILDITQTSLAWNYYSSKDGILRDSFTITKTKQLPREI